LLPPPTSTLCPYTTLFRSVRRLALRAGLGPDVREPEQLGLERAQLAQVGASLEERSPQDDGVDVVALARGERRERGAEPEADEADPRPPAPALCFVDRAVHVGEPACETGLLGITGRIAAAEVVEAQDGETHPGQPSRELDERAVRADVLLPHGIAKHDRPVAGRAAERLIVAAEQRAVRLSEEER